MGKPLEHGRPERVASMDTIGDTVLVYTYVDGSMAIVRLDRDDGDYLGVMPGERAELARLILGDPGNPP